MGSISVSWLVGCPATTDDFVDSRENSRSLFDS